jgi:iodotyrosine deiodinase
MQHPFTLYQRKKYAPDEMKIRAENFFEEMKTRRSVREFSDEAIPEEVLANVIAAAATAPSGANKQPWTFCVVTDPELKHKIRIAAEEEEKLNYGGRMSDGWLKDLAPLGTDANKAFLEKAPALIVVFRRPYEVDEMGIKYQNYYVAESVGIACGFLIAAIHLAGLCCLTHTPSPMNFLEKLLDRPSNERAFLLLPIGFPDERAMVPVIDKKSPSDFLKFYR